jgi:hypothetical protein
LLEPLNAAMRSKYGLEMTAFVVENVSVPPELEQAIDKRGARAVGDRDRDESVGDCRGDPEREDSSELANEPPSDDCCDGGDEIMSCGKRLPARACPPGGGDASELRRK